MLVAVFCHLLTLVFPPCWLGYDAGVLRRGLGFLPVEVNASDTRNKSDSNTGAGIGGKLANSIKELATNRAIGFGSDGKPKKVRPKGLTHVALVCSQTAARPQITEKRRWTYPCDWVLSTLHGAVVGCEQLEDLRVVQYSVGCVL